MFVRKSSLSEKKDPAKLPGQGNWQGKLPNILIFYPVRNPHIPTPT